ncbi:MAG: exodeoxyribonuclease III [Candidatus Eremiobacteraeota bacterium]|nr:exodeoxyribonuclease III [Candidatus Eremiobacteraeota bacterium]
MKVVTLNVNGIRSAARKGFYAWMEAQDADIVCLQETKAQEHQLPLEAAAVAHYSGVFFDAGRKGYSGVAMYAKEKPLRVVRGFGWRDFDQEARYLQFDYERFSIASLYVVSGAMGPSRQAVKEEFLERLYPYLENLRTDGRPYILCGDYNIAHREIDVYNPKRCEHISGFFPRERAWMDRVLNGLGWVDAFRHVNPHPGEYTWWSNFQKAFEHNRGWRLDYQLVTPDLAASVHSASIYKASRFSDHAPVIVEYRF